MYKNEFDKTCFQHKMASGDFKDLAKRTASDKVLIGKAFKIASNPNMMDIKEVLLLWFINFLIKRLLVEQLNLCRIKNLQMNFTNQLLENLKREKYSSCNIWGADLVDTQLISKLNRGNWF